MLRPAVAQLLDPVGDAPVGQPAQPVQSERRARSVSHQLFPAHVVVACDGDAGVQVEALDLDGAFAARRGLDAAVALGLRVRIVAQCAHRTALRRNGGARLERRLRARLLRGIFGRGGVHELPPRKPGDGAPVHPLHDLVELLARGRRRGMEARASLLVVGEDAVEEHRMEVNVKID